MTYTAISFGLSLLNFALKCAFSEPASVLRNSCVNHVLFSKRFLQSGPNLKKSNYTTKVARMLVGIVCGGSVACCNERADRAQNCYWRFNLPIGAPPSPRGCRIPTRQFWRTLGMQRRGGRRDPNFQGRCALVSHMCHASDDLEGSKLCPQGSGHNFAFQPYAL